MLRELIYHQKAFKGVERRLDHCRKWIVYRRITLRYKCRRKSSIVKHTYFHRSLALAIVSMDLSVLAPLISLDVHESPQMTVTNESR